MFIVLIRTIFLYFLVTLSMRLMGKRQIGELQPYEFVITILISDLAALPMQDQRFPLILGIVPIITLLFVKTSLTHLQLKSQFARKVIEGEPTILICRGKINFENLKKQQINLDELMESIRLAGYFDLKEIEYGILENSGKMSFLTTETTLRDALHNNYCRNNPNKKAEDLGHDISLPIIYILDGSLNSNSLTSSGKDSNWVKSKLKSLGYSSIDDILLFMSDTSGKYIVQSYDDYKED